MTTTMPLEITWADAAVRLLLAGAAGVIVGYDRSEHGRPAGLRTTLLVCLAAAVSMIQVNLLLPMAGKAPDSFVVLDLMRLPLGILTGMGFIGAGAILRRGEMVSGVTTAATLWMVTTIGLCFGGGQLGLGLAALALCLAALWGLKRLERRMAVSRHAMFTLVCTADGPTKDAIREQLAAESLRVESWDVAYWRGEGMPRQAIRCRVGLRALPFETWQPAVVDRLARSPGVLKIRWQM